MVDYQYFYSVSEYVVKLKKFFTTLQDFLYEVEDCISELNKSSSYDEEIMFYKRVKRKIIKLIEVEKLAELNLV